MNDENTTPIPSEPEAPPPVEPARRGYWVYFQKTTHHENGTSSTSYHEFQLHEIDGVDNDELVRAIIPVYEAGGWEFRHVSIGTVTVDITTYDPRTQ